ncbi:MAPEG family protein [Mangrovitalea sediminis]|uniref:MAPEG family protein n=1 Tax=Mangrovitalea sediminis TaxID=1982043 RepID=UPI000BE5A711|nr:MAPEG family protein [Mangrovitalea sediminis]
MVIPVTAFFASITALLMLFLAYRVTVFRRRFKVGLGDHGDREFNTAIRAHANLVENAPITLLLLGIAELNGVNAFWIYVLGLVFVASRLLHAWGFIRSQGGAHVGRLLGMVGTWFVLLALVVLNIWNVAMVSGRF